jgi:hypothetical protein
MPKLHPSDGRTLRDIVKNAVIIAYKEDVSRLEIALAAEGFDVQVIRANYTDKELKYSRNSKTFVSHRTAWQKVVELSGYTLICEADFVPCRGIGDFEVFWPLDNPYAWGYLYQGSPRILAIVGPNRFLRGHTSPLVCYAINGAVASLMLKFFEDEMERYDFSTYFSFDAHLQWNVMGLGGEAYIPMRHYGEHGGLPNPEHATLGLQPNQGRHRADNLMGPLHFLPPYANGSYLSFLRVRFLAHVKGLLRLLTGRWFFRTNAYRLQRFDLIRIYLMGLRRLVSWPL